MNEVHHRRDIECENETMSRLKKYAYVKNLTIAMRYASDRAVEWKMGSNNAYSSD